MFVMASLYEDKEKNHEEEVEEVLHNTIQTRQGIFLFLKIGTAPGDVILISQTMNRKGIGVESSNSNNQEDIFRNVRKSQYEHIKFKIITKTKF